MTGPDPGRHSVLIGFREIAGFCANLELGFTNLGVRCHFVNLNADPRQYGSSRSQPRIGQLASAARRRARGATGVRRLAWGAADRLTRAVLFGWALLSFDTFVFVWGESFFRLRDLGLLRRMGKRVIFVYLGSDSRPSYLNGAEVETVDAAVIERAIAATRRKVESLRTVERYASAIVSHPPSAQLHRRPFLPFLEMGLPQPALAPIAAPPSGDLVRVLHAPSHPRAKGTAAIREAVRTLREDGVPIELVEIDGRPHAEVLEAITTCHFVVDQAYADTPMGAFVSEAAALGRAAVVGGYAWDDIDRLTPAESRPPVERCRPEELAEAIRRLATDAGYRDSLATAAHRFVRERWAPDRVAGRYLQLADGTLAGIEPIVPSSLHYVLGAAMPESRVRENVHAVIDGAGLDGLSMDHNHGLRQRLVDLGSQ